MLLLPPHNKVSLTFPITFHFHLLSYYTFYFSLSFSPEVGDQFFLELLVSISTSVRNEQ
jgi:hypothetical protein